MAIVEPEHLRSEPGGDVHAVGDVPDGNFVFGLAFVKARPHIAGDLAMKSGNGVGAPRKAEGEHRHAEGLVGVVRLLATQSQQALLA